MCMKKCVGISFVLKEVLNNMDNGSHNSLHSSLKNCGCKPSGLGDLPFLNLVVIIVQFLY